MKKLLFSLILVSTLASAEFTQPQKDLLNTAIRAEPSIATCVTEGNDGCMADWLNSTSTFVVWKTALQEVDVLQSDAFNFSLVDSLTAGKRDEWSNFLFREGKCNPSKANIRAGLLDIWSGTAAKTSVYNEIISLSKRNASQAEKVLATGTGTTATPEILTFEGSFNINELPSILGR